MDTDMETDTVSGIEEVSKESKRFEKLKKQLMKEAKKAENKGVCYLSRIPPKMDPFKLRQILSPFADVLRIYLVPQGPTLLSPFILLLV